MSKFKIGDRVAVYTGGESAMYWRETGIVINLSPVNGTEMLVVDLPGSPPRPHTFHPKQCRRLVKKERRRVWINFYSDRTHQAFESKMLAQGSYAGNDDEEPTAAEFIEVRTKSTGQKRED